MTSHDSPRSCARFASRLDAWPTCSAAEREALVRDAEACPGCRGRLDEVRQWARRLDDARSAYRSLPYEGPTPRLAPRSGDSRRPSGPWHRRPRWLAAAAVTIAIGGLWMARIGVDNANPVPDAVVSRGESASEIPRLAAGPSVRPDAVARALRAARAQARSAPSLTAPRRPAGFAPRLPKRPRPSTAPPAPSDPPQPMSEGAGA